MNYLQEILNFEKLQELNRVSAGQARVWYVLMYLNNIAGWKSWFTVASSTLEFRSGLSRQGVIKARNELKQLGYIDFKTHGRKATSYQMKSLMPHSLQPSLQDSVQGSLHVGLQDSVQTSVQDGSALYKQNKTKQNKTNSSSESPTPNEKEPEPEKKAKREYDHQSEPYCLAEELKNGIMANNPDHKKITESQLQNWADDMRKMLELDKRSYSQVSNMISWCQRDDFWKTNILSASKLRKQ